MSFLQTGPAVESRDSDYRNAKVKRQSGKQDSRDRTGIARRANGAAVIADEGRDASILLKRQRHMPAHQVIEIRGRASDPAEFSLLPSPVQYELPVIERAD